MNAASNGNQPSRNDAVTGELLLLADGKEIQPPDDVLNRVRARLHEHTVPSSSTRSRPGTRQIYGNSGIDPKRAWIVGVGAAAVALIALIFWMQPSNTAWSQVVQTVQAMPWIHAKAVTGDGVLQESWASFSRDIAAIRTADMIRFDDYRSGIRYEYDKQQNKLFRLSTSGREQFESEEAIFQAIFRGDATLGDRFPEHAVIQQRQRTVDGQGRPWILYELQFGDPESRQPGKTTSVVIRVDPQKMLPDSMTFTRGDKKWRMAIDYPDEGPADIYALGVPRDTPVEDRAPPPDLNRILKIVEHNRRDFGDYLAVAGGDNENRRFAVHLVRCKGAKCRVDIGLGDTRQVASAEDMEQWWREHGRDVLPVGSVLCDGDRVYERNFIGREAEWKLSKSHIPDGDGRVSAARTGRSRAYFVDLKAYPPTLSPEELASTPLLTVHLDPTGENGPDGSVRVERFFAQQGGPADRSTAQKEEFWLQPEYGYAVVQYAFSPGPTVDKSSLPKKDQPIWRYEDFRQTPSGVWYPTVVRQQSMVQSVNEEGPKDIEVADNVMYFYLDFTAELPDELFSPRWQGDLLRGIHSAPLNGNSTSNDLANIRPPGGAPLIRSRSVLTPEVMDRVRQRLKAAPQKELDDWIAELERITGKKLDSWVERQGCRSDFVTRISVAFDGLQWNADKAAALFQRVRTMPPSEARAWKKAFETLLNEEIEPAYTVPLVLVPVDALHEGQQYSPERAGKYLARLRQLTADDVSLWKDKVDEFGGRSLDAAMNIILLDEYFAENEFQRGKFTAAIEARLGVSPSDE